jgi:hypothetical protein
MRITLTLAGCLAWTTACSSSTLDTSATGEDSGTDGTSGTSSDAGAADSSKPDSNKPDAGESNSNKPDAANSDAGAPDATKSDASAADAAIRTPATGTPGQWEDVTSSAMDPALFTGGAFGVGNIVTDPARPTDLYVGGYGSIWKSTDYGLTWSQIDSKPNPPYLPLGHVLAVAGTTPATLWMANVNGPQHVFRSTDAGLTFTLTGTIAEQPDAASLYSIVVDPYDATHLITGLHEQDKVLESTDSGDTWHFVSGSGWPTGGISWFPYFLDTGKAASTKKTWIAIAQNGASVVTTTDAAATWAKPKGIENLQHPHGGTGLYQDTEHAFLAGTSGPDGDGVYRSTDLGVK